METTNFQKKVTSGQKLIKGTSPMSSANSKWSRYQIPAEADNLWFFLDQIYPKNSISAQKQKEVNITIEFCIFKLD